jgi:hypothetical protein
MSDERVAGMSSQLREELRGRGNLYQGDKLICDVTYEVYLLQELIETKTKRSPKPKLKACYGSLYASGYFFNILGQEMTLHLEDGRYLDCVAEDWNKGRLEIICSKPYS